MSDAAPPWREITTEDYHLRIFPATIGSAQWIASSNRVYDLPFKRMMAGPACT